MVNGIITEFDSKEVMKVRMRFGAEGYLAYVAIQELLLRSEECRMECDYDAIAAEICVEPDVIKGVVESLGLFVLTDGYFTSETITAFCEEQKRRQKMYSERARKGGEGKAALSKKQGASSTENDASSTDNLASSNKNSASSKESPALSMQKSASSTKNPALSTGGEKKASPIPPIKKNALTGGSPKESLLGFKGAGTEAGESDNGQTDIPKQPKKREKIVVPTARARDEVWIPKYKSLYEEEPYVDGAEMTHLKNLLVKLRSKRLNKGLTIDDDGILEAFRVFLDKINKDWIYNNYSLKQINSHFNEIISQINNKQKPQKYENNSTREKDRRGTSVDESFQNLDYEERF